MRYFFILGRDKELSFAELISYFKLNKINYKIISLDKEVLIIEMYEFDSKNAIKKLGGVIKIGEIIEGDLFYDGQKNKIKYVISNYGCDKKEKYEKYIKDWFNKNKIKAIRSKAKTNKLDPRDISKESIEFVLLKDCIGRTLAIANLKEYKERDRERPKNDFMRSMSIRLAKIMINLSQIKKNQTLLDPFCGIGIVLEEGLLQGLNVVGVDIDVNICNSAKENLRWIKTKYNLKNDFEIINGDSRKINRYIKKADAVVSEPYLGPYLKKIPERKVAEVIIKELEEMYYSFLVNLRKIVKGLVVIIVPSIKSKSGIIKLNFEKVIKNAGFRRYELKENIKFPISYGDEKKVIREIYVLY